MGIAVCYSACGKCISEMAKYKGRTVEDIFEVGQLYYPSRTTRWMVSADDAYAIINLRRAQHARAEDERFQCYFDMKMPEYGGSNWNPYEAGVMLILSKEKISSPKIARHDGSPRYAYKVLHYEKIFYISALSGAKKAV